MRRRRTLRNRPGQSVKLANARKKIEFVSRLLRRSITAFAGAGGAVAIHAALTEAKSKVDAALADTLNLPATLRFGASGAGFTVGTAVTVKEKVAGKYGATLSGSLTVKEIGPSMILVANASEQLS